MRHGEAGTATGCVATLVAQSLWRQWRAWRYVASLKNLEQREAQSVPAKTTDEVLSLIARLSAHSASQVQVEVEIEDRLSEGTPWDYGVPLRHCAITSWRNRADEMYWDVLLLGAPPQFQPAPGSRHRITRCVGMLVTHNGNHKLLCEAAGAPIDGATLRCDICAYTAAYDEKVSRFGWRFKLAHVFISSDV